MDRIGRESKAAIRQFENDKTVTMASTNPLIGDNFFKANPDKVLGVQSIDHGRFGNEIIKVKGSLSSLDTIDAAPVAVADIYPSSVQTTEVKKELIEAVFEKEYTKQLEKKRGTAPRPLPVAQKPIHQEVYTTREIGEIYNKQISREELEAYFIANPDFNYKLLFDEFTFSKEDLIKKGLLFFEEGRWIYKYTYESGNISKKITILRRDQDKMSAAQFERQLAALEAARPKQLSLVGDGKIVILPHSTFSKDMKITEFKFGKPELNGETSLFMAFRQWLRTLTPDSFVRSNYHEIIKYYLDNDSIPINKDNKVQQVRDEKNAINIRQRTKEEGDRLFAQMLAEELTPNDQVRISYIWNEKMNSLAEPNLTKIPVAFRISKTFKDGLPFQANPTQRQAAAFIMEKLSGLLAYGVGVGKTGADIICMSQAIDNGLASKPLVVVPTNTYDKWMGEIQGYTDKDMGKFMHGLLPHLPPIVGLFNLNPQLVRNTLKIYTKQEEKKLETIEEVITFIKNIERDDPNDRDIKAINAIYPVNIPGLEGQYNIYQSETKSKTVKSFKEFIVSYLKDEYNYYIYDLGKIKDFPDGTIFVTTEVGIQRIGVSDANKDELATTLYSILSQGEISMMSEGGTSAAKAAKAVAKLELQIQQKVSSSLKNAKINIEDLKIDFVTFDEAHYYKKLFTSVKGEVTGEKKDYETGQAIKKERDKSKYELKSGAQPSSRALSAYVISHYVQSKNANRNVLQLTATPFTNSPLEVYSMLTLTNFKALQDIGLNNMVDFFDTFMKINYDIKYTPQKTVVKDVVLTGFNNLPQLRQIIYSLMDKKDEGANLIRPDKILFPSKQEGRETTLPMTAEQNDLMKVVKAYIQGDTAYEEVCASALQDEIDNIDFDGVDDETLITEWERSTDQDYTGERENLPEVKRDQLVNQIKNARVKGLELGEGDLNEEESKGVRILKGLSMMRQITLSPYLYYKACQKAAGGPSNLPNYKEYIETSPKLRYVIGCIRSIIDYHIAHNEKVSGQVIYMNAGVEYFPLIKEYLVKVVRLKESQVGMVTGKMSKGAKESVKRGFLNGEILVLIGSSTISVGVDLQNNASALYNCYYDWNPTDAAQIEGRVWRQGNRFQYVRINYPQCYNSADPVIFEYLDSKTKRINEIWDRSSGAQELDLRDFDPKELQKKLITDPEEKAEYDILQLTEKIDKDLNYYDNRREMLVKAKAAFNKYTELRPQVISLLNQYYSKKLADKKQYELTRHKDKISELYEKFGKDPEKFAAETKKYEDGRYDHINDPDKRYEATDYSKAADPEIVNQSKRLEDAIDNWSYEDRRKWGSDFDSSSRIMSDFRSNYLAKNQAEERILTPLGLTFETATDPIADFDIKINDLRDQLNNLEESKPARIEAYRKEQDANKHNIKTVQDRIDEWAGANDLYLPGQLNVPKKADNQITNIPAELLVLPVDETIPVTDTPSQQDIKDYIAGLELLAEIGNEDAITEIAGLQLLLD